MPWLYRILISSLLLSAGVLWTLSIIQTSRWPPPAKGQGYIPPLAKRKWQG